MLTKYRIEADGKETVLWTSAKPYELRRPKGLSVHAPERWFLKGKPQYIRDGNLLVILPARKRRG
jgi:hypothetical protein